MPFLSVIIPTLNEASHLAATLACLETATTPLEILVIDGGSRDETVAIAQSWGARVLVTDPGRAWQLNAGATIAKGNRLLFLHADTRLPSQFDYWIHELLDQPGVIAGAFELRLDADLPGLRWVERGVNWRSRLLQLPYGDQALFLNAAIFRELGGFPELPMMEDFEFVRNLRRRGRVAIAPVPAITSARRWQKRGVLKTTLLNQMAIGAYLMGIPPARIIQWYR